MPNKEAVPACINELFSLSASPDATIFPGRALACGNTKKEERPMGKLVDKTKGAVNEAIGKARQHSDDPATRRSGIQQEIKGKAQKLKGDVEGALGNKI